MDLLPYSSHTWPKKQSTDHKVPSLAQDLLFLLTFLTFLTFHSLVLFARFPLPSNGTPLHEPGLL
jgi:hypothetical protein